MSELKFDITGDNTQFLAALKQAQQGISATIDQLSKSGGKVDESMSEAAHKMGSSVQKASTEAKQGVSQLEQEYARLTSAGSKATTQAGDLKDKIAEQKAVIQQVKADVRDLQKAYENAAPGKAQNEAYAEFKAAQKVLEEEKVILASLEDEQKKYEASTKSLKAQLREMTERMVQMRIEGKANTEEYKELEKESAKLADAMADVNRAKKNLASDTGTFDAMVSGANLAAGAVSAYAGAMEMFGVNTEDAEEAQRGLQAAMAISTGLQNVQNQLQKESAVMLGLTNIQRRASVIATNLETAAQGKNIVVTKLATIAQVAFNAVAKANPYVLLATALISVVGALALFVKGKKDAAKAEKEHQAQMAQSKKLLEAQAEKQKAIAGEAAKVASKFLLLQTEWKRLKTVAEKTDWIKKNQSSFDSLGISIQQISTAEKVFSSQTQQFARAMAARAIAAAKAAQAVEEYNNFVANKQKSEKTNIGVLKEGDSYEKLSDEELQRLYKKGLTKSGLTGKSGTLSKEAAADAMEYRREKAREASRKKAEENVKKQRELYANIEKAYTEELEASEKLAKMGDMPVSKDKGDAKKKAEAQKKEREKLNEELQTLEQQNIDDSIKIREDGTAKEIAEINNSYNKKAKAIEKTKADWKKRNKENGVTELLSEGDYAGLTNDQAKVIKEAMSQAEQERNKLTAIANLNAARQQREAENELLKEYGTAQEQRYAIAKEWDEKIADLEAKGVPEAAIKKANKDKSKALADFDFEQVKKDINWEYIFGDLDNVNTETLQTVNDQLKVFMERVEELSPDQIQTVVEAMNRLQEKMDLSNPIETIKRARQEYADAKKEFEQYKKDLEAAQKAGDVQGSQKATKGMTKADQKMTKAKNSENKAFAELTDTVNNYAEALSKAGDVMGGATGECVKLAAGAIQAGVGIANGIKAFGNAVSAMEKSVAILAIIEAALQAIQMIAQLFGDSADQTLTNYVATMDTYLNLLKDSINDVSQAMKNNQNTTKETIAYYEQLIELEKKQAMGIKSQSQTWLNSGASKGFLGIGSSSSEGVKIVKQMKENMNSSNEEVKRFYQTGYNQLNKYYKDVYGVYAKSVGDFGRLDWIWRLSDDDLRALSQDTEAMAMLGDELSGAINQYVQAVGSATDALEDQFESLLSVSYDDFYDEFTDMIKDMDNESQDFAKNFGQYMYNALVKNMVAEKYKERLKKLYDKAGEMATNGTLEKNIKSLQQEYTELTTAAANDASIIARVTGVMEEASQKATANGVQNITADQADQLVGRITAMQIAVEAERGVTNEMAERVTTGVDYLMSINVFSAQANETLNAILLQHVQSNSYLEDITKYNKNMYNEWGSEIVKMRQKLEQL